MLDQIIVSLFIAMAVCGEAGVPLRRFEVTLLPDGRADIQRMVEAELWQRAS